MKRLLSHTLILVLMAVFPVSSFATEGKKNQRETKKFNPSVLLYKGECVAGGSVLYASFNSGNSEILLIANNIDASGSFFRIAPSFQYAYMDNASVGFRFAYNGANGKISRLDMNLGDDLNFDVRNTALKLNGWSAGIFHRNYIGLDKKGTVGLFCEFQLGYSYNRTETAAADYSISNRVKLSFAPGLYLYVLPFVSLELSVGLADVSYNRIRDFKNNEQSGTFNKFDGGVKFNLLNCNFGIAYHF